uniref:Uncharacterized protein n=1 Tax=Rhizophora mucronata TaxID=61149 RepID=A0A2P2PPK4_RHIMU
MTGHTCHDKEEDQRQECRPPAAVKTMAKLHKPMSSEANPRFPYCQRIQFRPLSSKRAYICGRHGDFWHFRICPANVC